MRVFAALFLFCALCGAVVDTDAEEQFKVLQAELDRLPKLATSEKQTRRPIRNGRVAGPSTTKTTTSFRPVIMGLPARTKTTTFRTMGKPARTLQPEDEEDDEDEEELNAILGQTTTLRPKKPIIMGKPARTKTTSFRPVSMGLPARTKTTAVRTMGKPAGTVKPADAEVEEDEEDLDAILGPTRRRSSIWGFVEPPRVVAGMPPPTTNVRKAGLPPRPTRKPIVAESLPPAQPVLLARAVGQMPGPVQKNSGPAASGPAGLAGRSPMDQVRLTTGGGRAYFALIVSFFFFLGLFSTIGALLYFRSLKSSSEELETHQIVIVAALATITLLGTVGLCVGMFFFVRAPTV